MMNPATILLVALGALILPQSKPSHPVRLAADVDPRVELMSIIFRLAGNPEYNQKSSASPYAAEVDEHFGKYRDHAAVRLARELRASRGVSFDAVMSMALHISDASRLKERIPFDRKPERLDGRWPLKGARKFLAQARDFARKSGFKRFFAKHRALYEEAAQRMEKVLRQRSFLPWFEAFFGARPRAKFHLSIGLLLGGGNYGVGVRFPDGSEEIHPIIGAWRFDPKGIPLFDDSIAPTVAHEFCHSYTNSIVDRHAAQLQGAGEKIFATCATVMKRMAYGNWKTVMYESLVRACVVRYLLATGGKAAADQEIRRQRERGFAWVGALSEVLAKYEAGRRRFKDFDAFMPQVVEFFDSYAAELAVVQARTPKVKAMVPANGARDVDPALKEICITFDRPMLDGMWAVVGGGPHFPKITAKVHYDESHTVFTIPVHLKPDWSYTFWLNRGRFNSFRSAEGIILRPFEVRFRTRGKRLDK